MSSDRLDSLICPQCGHDLLDSKYDDFNPRKRLNALRLERHEELNKLFFIKNLKVCILYKDYKFLSF